MAASVVQSNGPWRIGLITNPGSGRNRKGLRRVRGLCAGHPGVACHEASEPEAIATALAALSDFEPEVLAVNGGDGTVQAVLTALFRDKPFAKPPMLALLRGGTTNMTAGDVGMKGSMLAALQRLLKLAQQDKRCFRVDRRPILKVDITSTGQSRYGMFFGAGTIINGIEYCHEKVHSKGFRDAIAPGICTLRLLLAMARKDSRYAAPVPMTITTWIAEGQPQSAIGKQDYHLVLASPLERLFLGLRPYWGPKRGALYFSALRANPAHPFWALPPLFWGRAGRTATRENGYYSEKVNELELEMDGPLTLDGEIYHASRQSGPVRVTVGGWASFLRA